MRTEKTSEAYCSLCQKKFCNKKSLKTHMASIHGDKIKTASNEIAASSSTGHNDVPRPLLPSEGAEDFPEIVFETDMLPTVPLPQAELPSGLLQVNGDSGALDSEPSMNCVPNTYDNPDSNMPVGNLTTSAMSEASDGEAESMSLLMASVIEVLGTAQSYGECPAEPEGALGVAGDEISLQETVADGDDELRTEVLESPSLSTNKDTNSDHGDTGDHDHLLDSGLSLEENGMNDADEEAVAF